MPRQAGSSLTTERFPELLSLQREDFTWRVELPDLPALGGLAVWAGTHGHLAERHWSASKCLPSTRGCNSSLDTVTASASLSAAGH